MRILSLSLLCLYCSLGSAQDQPSQPDRPLELSNSSSVPSTAATAPSASQEADTAAPEVDASASDQSAVIAVASNDQQRATRIKELLTLVTDNTLYLHRRENPAYFALVKEAKDQTAAELRAKARENPRFNDFYRKPSEHRGELVHLTLNLRRVLSVPIAAENEANVTELFELWGWTEEAKAWMYCCIVPELPPGIEVGDSSRLVELTGYFFKMQAYQPGDAAPNARNLVAPLIIGRIEATQRPAPQAEGLGYWPLLIITGFGMVIFMRVLMNTKLLGRSPTHRNYRRRSLDTDSLGEHLGDTGVGLKIRNADEV